MEPMTQKTKRPFLGIRGLLPVLLIAVVLIATFLFFQNKSVDDIVSTNIENMKELALHDECAVYNLVENYTSNLRTVETIMKKEPPGSVTELTNRLGILKSAFDGADYIALVASDGMSFQSTGIAKTDTELFSLCQTGGDDFIVRYDQLNAKAIDNQKVTILIGIRVSHIAVEGHDIEYIVCITPSKYLQDRLKIDSYDGLGYSAIIEKDGNYLLNVNEQLSYPARENFFDDYVGADYSGFASDAEFREAVRNCSEQFFAEVTIRGESYIIVFSPMEISGWLYVTSVPKTVFEQQSSHLTSTYLAMMSIIILAVFGAMIKVFRSANKERTQKERLLRAEERAKDAEIIRAQNNQLEEQQKALEEALNLAQNANRAKTTFLNNMSHDIRTPMNAIVGYTGLASAHIDSRELVQDYLRKIGQSSEHLLSLINDVLDMSRIESGKMTLAEKDEDLAEILHTLRNIVQSDVNVKQLVGDQAPIIVLTAYDWADIEEEAREAGVTAFISKPLFPTDLRSALNKCCGGITDEPAAAEMSYDFTGKKILLVEDNEMNREIATEILKEEGFILDTAEDGSVAVEKMKTAVPGQYDLVLMDVQMPIMDGYEAAKQICALPDPVIANITILAMTANAFEEDRKAALAAGMNEHLTKPIEVDKLKAMLAKFLNL